MTTFKHSGDLGDIIFSLPCIKAKGGGTLYLDPEGGKSSPLVKWADRTCTKLNQKSIDLLKPLLLEQDYIVDVLLWKGETVDHDLDQFRRHIKYNNLSDSHLASIGLPFHHRDVSWITVKDPIIPPKPIIISRSVRYHGNFSFWENILPSIKNDCVFVGYEKEHEIFEYTFGHKVKYHKTETIMELAQLIAGCSTFIGNQGFPHALAEGMKKKLINEVFRVYPAAVFNRDGAEYV